MTTHTTTHTTVREQKFSDDELLKTRTTILTEGDPASKRQEIREYFHRTFTLFERMHEVFKNDETHFLQPEKLRHPLIFYLCHTAVLYINKLKLAKIIKQPVDERIEALCAVGVDEMSWDDLNVGKYAWPTADQARAYRDKVRQTVDHVIQTLEMKLPITWDSPWWIIVLGIEHERIHLETSSVLFRQLPIEEVKPHSLWKLCPTKRTDLSTIPQNVLLPVDQFTTDYGKAQDHPLYGWDNEYGEKRVTVPAFKASKFLVSNGEYYEFVMDKGYSTQKYWTEEGWRFVTWKKAKHPVFWVPVNPSGDAKEEEFPTQFKYRSFVEEIPMPWDWPVDVNFMEAKAFCNWKAAKTGKAIRLPTEEEWYSLRDQAYPQTKPDEADQPYWETAPANINLEHWASSCPVDMFGFKGGFFDVFGNVWQHCETPIMPFKGFRTHKIYDDFSVPTFDSRHNMIKGGSWISTGNEATRLARYAFRRHFFQHAGFRYVESDTPLEVVEQPAELEPEVAAFIDVHYGPAKLGVESFPFAVAKKVKQLIDEIQEKEKAKAEKEEKIKAELGAKARPAESKRVSPLQTKRLLDLGCRCGRASFELARTFEHVVGLDLTTRFMRIASDLQDKGTQSFKLKSSGDLETYYTVELSSPALQLEDVRNARKCEFWQADFSNLDPKYKDFDVVLAQNVLTQTYNPTNFLTNIHTRINIGGLLIIVDTYDWDENITPKEKWLGGYKHAGENVYSPDTLERLLSLSHGNGGKFVQVNLNKEKGSTHTHTDVPLVVHRTDRSFEYKLTHLSAWRRVL